MNSKFNNRYYQHIQTELHLHCFRYNGRNYINLDSFIDIAKNNYWTITSTFFTVLSNDLIDFAKNNSEKRDQSIICIDLIENHMISIQTDMQKNLFADFNKINQLHTIR